MVVSQYKDVKTYLTKDGSFIRELMHPDHHQVMSQSLAEAIVSPGASTLRHKHLQSEEVYHIISGCGRMSLDDQIFEIFKGDTIVIQPNVVHHLANEGERS